MEHFVFLILPNLLPMLAWLVGIIVAGILIHRHKRYAIFLLIGSILLLLNATVGLILVLLMDTILSLSNEIFLIVSSLGTITHSLLVVGGITLIIVGFWKSCIHQPRDIFVNAGETSSTGSDSFNK
jgi:hypothetical protein